MTSEPPALRAAHAVISLRTDAAVTFAGPAAIDLLGEDAPAFARDVALLAESWRTGEPVQVQPAADRIVAVG